MKRREFMTPARRRGAAWPYAAHAQQPQSIDVPCAARSSARTWPAWSSWRPIASACIYQGAFGVADIGSSRPLQLDLLFRIASMTKAITSTAAMQLVEQNRLAIEDPVEKYLPEFATAVTCSRSFDGATGAHRLRPATKPVTIRHLFTHTSGLGYGFTSPTVRDFKPRAGEDICGGPAGVRTGRAVALQHQHGLAGPGGREGLGPAARGLFPPAHLHAARDGRHVLPCAEGQGRRAW